MTDNQTPYVGAYPIAAPSTGNTYSLVGMLLGVLGVAACPILFGPAGLFVSCVALMKGERLWPLAVGVSVVGIVGGLMLWIFVYGRVAPGI